MRDADFAVLCNECVVRCCFQYFIQGGIVQPPAFCLQDVNHSVSIDLRTRMLHAVAVLSFYRYPMQLLRTSAP